MPFVSFSKWDPAIHVGLRLALFSYQLSIRDPYMFEIYSYLSLWLYFIHNINL